MASRLLSYYLRSGLSESKAWQEHDGSFAVVVFLRSKMIACDAGE